MAGRFLIVLSIKLAVVFGGSSSITPNEAIASLEIPTPERTTVPTHAAYSSMSTPENTGPSTNEMLSDPISVKVLVGETDVLRVKEFTPDPTVKLPLMIRKKNISLYSVDYDHKKGFLFYVALDELIVRANVSGTQLTSPPTVLIKNALGTTHLAVDWLDDKLYWLSVLDDSGNYTIEVANMDGSGRRALLKDLIDPYNIAVDPYEKWLFYVSNKTVFRYNLTTTNSTEKLVFNTDVAAESIAIDRHTKTLYIVVKTNASIPYIARSEYDGSKWEILKIIGEKYNDIISIDVFRNRLIFVDYSKDLKQDTVYSVDLKSNTNSTNSESKLQPVIWHTSTNGDILSLKFYHPNVQTETDTTPCLDMDL